MTGSKPNVVFGLETPRPLTPQANYLRLEGWGFVAAGTAPPTARLRIGADLYSPQSTSKRPDVAARFPDERHIEACGFEFVVLLPFGLRAGVLEISGDAGQSWHKACDLMIPTTSHPIMGQFEPAGENGVITEATRLAGWCWHPELSIEKVVLLQGNTEVPVEWGLERKDVADRFPDQPESRFAGFMTRENLPRGRGIIRLQITTDCGRTFFLEPGFEAKISAGAFAPPRPPSEMWQLTPDRVGGQVPTESKERIVAGPTNILFVLHGDFTANSAYHVTALANELNARGYDCVVAVPNHPETIEAQPDARFLAIEFDELDQLANHFRDGLGPQVTHVWTPRELVRKFWIQLKARFDTQLLIHLEDNEAELLREHLQIDANTLGQMSEAQLDRVVPEIFSHPSRSREFLAEAVGITTIYESLQDFAPPGRPGCTFWPAATAAFRPLPINGELRTSLGIPESAQIIFYHGNTHGANHHEVGALYAAVAELNAVEPGSTWLVRTGRDTPEFAEEFNPRLGLQLIHLGFVKRSRDLPLLMSMADVFVQPGVPGAFNDYRFPSKLPEFFAIGRPVIVPRSNIGQSLQHHQDAYVLERADSASIAAAVREIRADESLRETLARGAIAFAAAHFSWGQSAEKLVDFYREVTALQTPSARQLAATQILNASVQHERLEAAP